MRHSKTSDGHPACPICATYGVETASKGEDYELDDGCTEPLCGPLCPDCEREMAHDISQVND